MQYKEKQFVHESRKNEREMSRLKEHLQQMDKGDNILIPPKIEVVNDLKRPGGRRRRYKNGSVRHCGLMPNKQGVECGEVSFVLVDVFLICVLQ